MTDAHLKSNPISCENPNCWCKPHLMINTDAEKELNDKYNEIWGYIPTEMLPKYHALKQLLFDEVRNAQRTKKSL